MRSSSIPWNGPALAILGTTMAFAGDWEHGCALVERAIALHARHPGWYWFALFYNGYRKGDDRGALGFARRIDLPLYLYTHVVTAAAAAELGEREAASQAVRELLALEPTFASVAREELAKRYLPDLVEHLVDSLRKAGLQIEGAKHAPATANVTSAELRRLHPATTSGGRDVSSGALSAALVAAASHVAAVAIAVLPFSDMSPARDQAYLCEGMAEEIMNALVRVDGIRVASRNSAFRAGHDTSITSGPPSGLPRPEDSRRRSP